MVEGRIKWYSEKKGYGFIETENGEEIFLHSTGFKIMVTSVYKRTIVSLSR